MGYGDLTFLDVECDVQGCLWLRAHTHHWVTWHTSTVAAGPTAGDRLISMGSCVRRNSR